MAYKNGVNTIKKTGSTAIQGDVTLTGGTNVTLTQTGNDISIAAIGGSATPGGIDTQVQFNGGGVFGGDAGLVYNKTTNKLSIIGGSLDVAGANSSFHNQLELDNDTALYFGGGIGNGTGLKTGSDGTFLFDTGTNQVIKFKGTTGGGTTFGYTDGVFNYVWRSNSYGATTQSWGATINTTAADSDTQIQGVTDPNLVFVDASTDRVGIGTNAPSTKLDVNSDRIRIRTSKTPLSAVDTGTTGDMCWDANFFYLCVATNTWKRSTLATW